MRNYDCISRSSRIGILALLVSSAALSALAQSAPPGTMQGQSPAMRQASPPGQASADSQASVVGTIGAVNGTTLFVTTADGAAKVIQIRTDTSITGRRPATLASIRPGEAMGVAATRGADGSLTATSINVFPPELWQRVRKGQFPMANGQVMTNAQVESLGAGVKGRQILLKFEMLTAAIDVPEGAEIRRTVTLGLADLRAGMKVTVRGTIGSDGSLAAANLSVELPGA